MARIQQTINCFVYMEYEYFSNTGIRRGKTFIFLPYTNKNSVTVQHREL